MNTVVTFSLMFVMMVTDVSSHVEYTIQSCGIHLYFTSYCILMYLSLC